jgi:hypothetical protein
MTHVLRRDSRRFPHVLVCTTVTHKTPGLRVLEASCARFGIGLTRFGWGERYPGHSWKVHTLQAGLERVGGEYELVLFVDGFDSLFMTGLGEILRAYRACDTPLLMAAEINCHPPEGPRAGAYPAAPTHYRYLNSGGLIGRVDYLRALLARYNRPAFWRDDNDQGFWAHIFVSGETRLTLDHHCRVFQCQWIAEQDFALARWPPWRRRLRNRATRTRPCILHGNGFCDMTAFNRFVLGRRYERLMAGGSRSAQPPDTRPASDPAL